MTKNLFCILKGFKKQLNAFGHAVTHYSRRNMQQLPGQDAFVMLFVQ
jgi:hypothetical protein